MPRRYSSFLLRCWVLDDELRVEVQHIQSGRRTRKPSITATLGWLETMIGGAPDAGEQDVNDMVLVPENYLLDG